MRQLYLTTLAILAIAGALLVANWRLTSSNTAGLSNEIALTNLPVGYCPTQAEIYHTSNQSLSVTLPVLNCAAISLASLDLAEQETIYLKLPKALGLTLEYRQGVDRFVLAPRVGDADGNNAIDKRDEQAVLGEMFSGQTKFDVNLDKKTDAEDLALVRINQAAGVNRPDGKAWSL